MVKKTGAAVVEVEDASLPAVRAVDAGRAALQRELLEVAPDLRLQYAAAMAAVKAAEELVAEGEKSPPYLAKKLQVAREIADKLDRILNDNPRRLRELCADAGLRREEHRLRVARNRAGEVLNGLRGAADNERLRHRRVVDAVSRDFGVKGQDWEWSAETGFEVLRPGAGRSGLERSQLMQVQREHQTALARAAEELAILEADLSEAERSWSDAKAAYEANREARTWSIH